MEELKFLSAAVLALILAVSCQNEYDPAAGDPDSGIAPGTAWEDVPEDWVCPVCGIGKDMFSPAE